MARVKALRRALGMTQEAFAERAGLKYKHYQAVEAGRKTEIHLSTVEKMAQACGLEPAELLDFTTDPVVLAEAEPLHGFRRGRPAARRKPAAK